MGMETLVQRGVQSSPPRRNRHKDALAHRYRSLNQKLIPEI